MSRSQVRIDRTVSHNNGYITYFHYACTKQLYFHFRSKNWRHYRVPRLRFPTRRGNVGDLARSY